ncbi:hypothetical protein [Methylobacterium radiotolerans]|uniref:hypothetical protein n=1 Tax=Methylobacterium radiotolerans TaxID=31998 RepID=UPI0038CFA921
MIRSALTVVALFSIATLPVRAAPIDAPRVVATAALPKAQFRHVTMNGTTKPAGLSLDGRSGTTPDLDRKSGELHRLLATSICTGC